MYPAFTGRGRRRQNLKARHEKSNQTRTRRKKRRRRRLKRCFLAVLLVLLALWAPRLFYPLQYKETVCYWAQVYDVDPLLVNTFIRTESGFDPSATSSVNARGLMQMTEETFEWLKGKIAPEEELTFDDLYDPEVSIRFGCYYLHLCLQRYENDVATVAAAYHNGWGTVDRLLSSAEYSADGKTLDVFPYTLMNHYVKKITSCYEAYQRIYAGR